MPEELPGCSTRYFASSVAHECANGGICTSWARDVTTLLNDVSMMTPTAELTSVGCERHSLAGVEHYPTQPIFQRLGSSQLFKQEDHRTIVLFRGKIHAKLTSSIAA